MKSKLEFMGHPLELLGKARKVSCQIWEAKTANPSVVVFAYGYGETQCSKSVEELAEHICKEHGMSVIITEYAGTSLKNSEDLLQKLECILPSFLEKVSPYLKSKYQDLIKEKKFQDTINELYFDAFSLYPTNMETVIPLYGNENEYQDFGLAPALDLLYGIQKAKEQYPLWNWEDCIGLGNDYGGYLIEMAEKLSPNTFSMIVNDGGFVSPRKEDIFTNMTEWENGANKITIKKNIGRFLINLVEIQGWTVNQDHPFGFKPHHFDIRNLANISHVKLLKEAAETPRLYIGTISEDKQLTQLRQKYIERLVEQGFSLDYFIAGENDVDEIIVNKQGNKLVTNIKNYFDICLANVTQRRTEKAKKDFSCFPVNQGVYVVYDLKDYPKFVFIPTEGLDEYDSTENFLLNYSKSIPQVEQFINKYSNHTDYQAVLLAIKNNKLQLDEDYNKLMFIVDKIQ